jgi:hypothetical protein
MVPVSKMGRGKPTTRLQKLGKTSRRAMAGLGMVLITRDVSHMVQECKMSRSKLTAESQRLSKTNRRTAVGW